MVGWNPDPRLDGGDWHKRLMPQRIKQYPLDLWVKPGFLETTVKPISCAIHPCLSPGLRLEIRQTVQSGPRAL